VLSLNILKTSDLQLHERQIRAVLSFMNSKKVE
jgi:hypothetical protein